ncbi:hypothetical protein JIN85_02900 [Luteolibacter pohnpeiensis]|uniref:Uncharacterized protein n=1 Tax=Luteolibacter pohnpeiensis TaxID=454153 RepID=A0A934VPS8_9BACT|nr:hypothetical protein [Luteolibacter pohnpeiensis]MBK1881346.1 hypothetical protein [Luteolibacter pohnpeiensis]
MMLADTSTINIDSRSIIITAFATKDPHQALEWAQGKSELSTVLATIGSHNPQLAAQYCREILEQGNPQSVDLDETIYNISEALAKSGAKALLDFSLSMPTHSRFSILSSYLTQVPDEEQAMVLDEITKLQETNSIPPRQVATMFSEYARTNPELAKAWLASLPPSTSRDNLDIAMAKSLNANAKPNEARDQLARAIRSNAGEELKLLNRIALNDVEILPAFSAALPESVELKASDLQQRANIILTNPSDKGPTGIVDIAIALKGKDQQAELLSTALNQVVDLIQSNSGSNIQLNENDFLTLQSRIEALGLIDRNAEQVQAALDRARSALHSPSN